jgi:hypothetical protein
MAELAQALPGRLAKGVMAGLVRLVPAISILNRDRRDKPGDDTPQGCAV